MLHIFNLNSIIHDISHKLGIIIQICFLLGLDLNNCIKEVLVGHEVRLPPEGDHPRLDTHRLALGSVEIVRGSGEFLVVDVRIHVHLPGVDLHDPGPSLLRRGRELDLSVQSSGSEQSRVKNINSVGSSDNLI